MRRYIARRVLWTVFAAYLLLSSIFLVFAFAPDPGQETAGVMAALGGGSAEAAENAYAEARNYDKPILDRYIDWIVAYTTLDWGTDIQGEPVTDRLGDALPITLVYLVPAVVLSVVLGSAIGLYSAVHQHGYIDRLVTAITYPGLGLPSFWLASWASLLVLERIDIQASYFDDRYGLWSPENLPFMFLPMAVVTINLLAVQIRYTRSTSLEYVPAEFVKTLRSNGARASDVGRHVIRNAALPLVSLFFAETLTILFITLLVVETVFGLPGFGALAFQAIRARDAGLILATTMIPVFLGLAGNLLQDIAYAVLDPRVGYD
ncbi:ABC transporter permease [Haladaptatus cibarius]|uniref:ABC transporter permease n=1 Tax=Haladaptatus cibarius TaxID=453847 RepID=UPI000678C07D|nr:ABC transporter permease [Haladaptatus cibarius]